MVGHKSTEIESECYQIIGSLRKTIDVLKFALRDKQAAINSLIDIIKGFTVNETKKIGRREQQTTKVPSKGSDNDDIDNGNSDNNEELFVTDWSASPSTPKIKRPTAQFSRNRSISVGVNEDCYERNLNESVLNQNMYLSSSNANDKDIKNEKKNRQQNKNH